MQIVYHGSYCKIEEPKLLDNKYTKDFGKGFYCTIFRHPTHQIAFCTDEALKTLKFIGIEEI